MRTFATLLYKCAPWISVALLSFGLHTRGFADSSSATLSLEITDSSGALIQDAAVVLRNISTNQEQRSQSGKSGSAIFPFLTPGHYALILSKQGFNAVAVTDIVLNVGDQKNLELVLKVGSATQNVIVDGTGTTINTTDGSVSTVIDHTFVENIPLNGRSLQDLISMTPGIVTQSPQAQVATGIQKAGDFSVNGQRTESNYYAVDGVTANIGAGNNAGGPTAGTSGSIAASTALGTTQSLVSVDALQEFRVQSSSYSAEYGGGPGGQFTFATRSGTNQFHGSVFEYLRNSYFDANDWFNDHLGQPISQLRQNDFGGTIGGPILIPRLYDGKDKTFFFASYEGLRLAQPQPAAVQYVPDTYMRELAPGPLQPILNAFPLPSIGGTDYGNAANPNLAEFFRSFSLPSRIDSVGIRIDHELTPRLKLFFRVSDTPSSTESRYLSDLSSTTIDTQTYTLGATSQISGSLTNDFRLGYARADSLGTAKLDGFGGATPVDLGATMALGSLQGSEPFFYLDVPNVGYAYLMTFNNAANKTRQWNTIDTFSLSRGRHQVTFGLNYRRIISPSIPVSPLIQADLLNAQSVLHNTVDDLFLEKRISSKLIFNNFSLFLQDEWRLAPRLSLSAGLRWDVFPAPSEANGNTPYTLLGNLNDPASLSLAPQGTTLWKTGWYNFGPRLGAAATVNATPGWETVIRAGGGVFFDTADELAVNGIDGLGFAAETTSVNAPLPVTSAQLMFPVAVKAPYTSSYIYAFPKHLQLPYTLEWSGALEQVLGKAQALTLTYIGSNGRRLIQDRLINVSAQNPNFANIEIPTQTTSNYQALEAEIQRSMGRGIHALASYTWSHSLDYGSNDQIYPAIRGNSDFDIRSNFSGALSWDLPRMSGGRSWSQIVDRWGFDARLIARTAFPVTLQGNAETDPATGQLYYTGVNVVPGVPVYLSGGEYPGGRALNPGAFKVPAGTEIGNAPRNFVRGFNEVQLNSAVRREIPLFRELALQFRAEAFNVLNHPNFGYVDPILSNAQFGEATKMLNQSLGTVSSQYQQGGPRSLQFALKLLF
jgi:hypothetical protein